MKNRFFFLPVFFLIFSSCKENIIGVNEPETPFNPYDTINYTGNVITETPVDSNSFLGLHTYIFSQRCAVPACHDGSFEPDFRTVESAYNTLVFHPVVKNSFDNYFTYRVQPADTNKSWLHERLTTNDQTLGRMPLYSQPLSDRELFFVENWILSGARDVWGNDPVFPDFQPNIFGILAYLPDVGNMRVDSIRYNDRFYNPFIVPANSNVKIWIGLYDTGEDGSFQLPVFTYYKVKFSKNQPYDFSGATEFNLTREIQPHMGPTPFGAQAPYFYHITINTGIFSPGDIVYIRAYVNDGQHVQNTELPDATSQYYIITLFSFIVQ